MTDRPPTDRARSAVFAPLGDEGRATRVEQRIAQAIQSGVLDDGERLPSEAALASMLGVATVTAREALLNLRAQGLVTTTRGRGGGSFVRRPNRPDRTAMSARLASMPIVDLMDRAVHYSVIVTGCAELAAQNADPGDIETMRELLQRPDEPAAARHADSELFLTIAALTQSARLTRELVRLEADFGSLVRMPYDDDRFRRKVRKTQMALVDAIEAADSDAARRHVQDQVDAAVAWLLREKAA